MITARGACYRADGAGSYRLLSWLCYPRTCGCDRIVARLESLGFESLCYEPAGIHPEGVAGKGHSSIVLSGLMGGVKRAIKVRRRDSKRASLYREGLILEKAYRVGASPRPYYYDDDLIVMDYVDGPHLKEALTHNPLKAVEEALEAARALDAAGILHLEISRPWKHVKFTGWPGKALIIDYESSSGGCGNVVKLASGVLSRFPGGVDLLRRKSRLFQSYYKDCSWDSYLEVRGVVLDFLSSGK